MKLFNITQEVRTWYGLLGTFGGVGTFYKMPGTVGTFAAFLILLVAGGISWQVLFITSCFGLAAANRYAIATGKDDPQEIVIDEVAGYWLAMLGFGPEYAVIAFFLFRVFDILKPFPIRNMERLPGGLGIMADDLVGGAIVNVIIRLSEWVFYRGGLDVIYSWIGKL